MSALKDRLSAEDYEAVLRLLKSARERGLAEGKASARPSLLGDLARSWHARIGAVITALPWLLEQPSMQDVLARLTVPGGATTILSSGGLLVIARSLYKLHTARRK